MPAPRELLGARRARGKLRGRPELMSRPVSTNRALTLLVISVRVRVMLGCLFGMVLSVQKMAVRYMRVMAGFLMIFGVIVVSGRAMVPRGVLVIICCLTIMISALFRH